MRNFLVFLLVLSLGLAVTVRIRYGGGESYQDLSTPSILDETQLEQVLQYSEPIGNVAVSRDGRIFFTVFLQLNHQLKRPVIINFLESAE